LSAHIRPDDDQCDPRVRLRRDDTLQRLLDKGEGFLRHDALKLVDDRRDQVLVGEQVEDADGDEQHGWNGQERVVGERRSQVRDVVVEGLLAGADQNRQVVTL
jgi:hypothetical protein